jgi:hypothetical protein
MRRRIRLVVFKISDTTTVKAAFGSPKSVTGLENVFLRNGGYPA